MPQVSVIIPCHNAASFIAQAVKSLCFQSLQDWELIVVDDGSSDGSAAVVESLAGSEPRIRLFALGHNRGVCFARNAGARLATSPYLLFLDADDILLPEMLERTIFYLNEHPKVGAVYTRHAYIARDGAFLGVEPGNWPWARYVPTARWLRKVPSEEPATAFESLFLVGAMIPSITVMRAWCYGRAGGWDESFGQGCEDTDLFLRLASSCQIHHFPEVLVHYRVHPGQASKRDDFQHQYQRLTDKFSDLAAAGLVSADLVNRAMWFRSRRFVPFRALLDARRELRKGQLLHCTRSLVHAFRTYSPRQARQTEHSTASATAEG